MADDYRVKTSWRRHPKRDLLESMLGRDAVLAVVDLWGYVAECKPTGDLSGMSNRAIAVAAKYPGDADTFVAALTDPDVRLLDGGPGAYRVHDLEEHNPFVVSEDRRVEAARIGSMTRWHREKGHPTPVPGCPLCPVTHAPRSDSDATALRPDANRTKPQSSVSVSVSGSDSVSGSVSGSASSSAPPATSELTAEQFNTSVQNWPHWTAGGCPPAHWPKLLESQPYTTREIDFARKTVEAKPRAKWAFGLLLRVLLDERARPKLQVPAPGSEWERGRAKESRERGPPERRHGPPIAKTTKPQEEPQWEQSQAGVKSVIAAVSKKLGG